MSHMVKQIIGTVTAAAIGAAGILAWNFIASAQVSHQTTDQQKEAQAEISELVKSNTAVLEKLAERQLEKDAAREATIGLCKAGDISKCSICRGVGVYDAPACEK